MKSLQKRNAPVQFRFMRPAGNPWASTTKEYRHETPHPLRRRALSMLALPIAQAQAEPGATRLPQVHERQRRRNWNKKPGYDKSSRSSRQEEGRREEAALGARQAGSGLAAQAGRPRVPPLRTCVVRPMASSGSRSTTTILLVSHRLGHHRRPDRRRSNAPARQTGSTEKGGSRGPPFIYFDL